MLHLSLLPHGGLAVGVGAFGRAIWARRQPYVVAEHDLGDQVVTVFHRWSFWRTRAPHGIADPGDEGFGSAGVREPRRPLPGGLSGESAVRPPGSS